MKMGNKPCEASSVRRNARRRIFASRFTPNVSRIMGFPLTPHPLRLTHFLSRWHTNASHSRSGKDLNLDPIQFPSIRSRHGSLSFSAKGPKPSSPGNASETGLPGQIGKRSIFVPSRVAALLPILQNGHPGERAIVAGAPQRKLVRVPLCALRNLHRRENRPRDAGCSVDSPLTAPSFQPLHFTSREPAILPWP